MGTETTAREQRDPESLSIRVCLALAEKDDVHPWESTTLYGTLDPSVLDTLDSQENEAWRLEFQAGTHTVTVTGDGEVTVDGTSFSEREFQEALDSLDDRSNSQRPVIR